MAGIIGFLFKNRVEDKRIIPLMLSAYLFLMSIPLVNHESWADEAEAWLLARDCGIIELVSDTLRLQGHTFLWYVFLSPFAKLGFPFYTVKLLSIALAGISTYILLCHTPFPNIIKILLPLSYFFFYQYGVISRVYSLFPLLVFSIIAVYEKRRERILLFTVLACLLAAVSVHGFIMAIGVMSVNLLDLWKVQRIQEKKILSSYILFTLFSCFLVYQLIPPVEGSWYWGYKTDPAHLLQVGWRMYNNSYGESWILTVFITAVSIAWFSKRRVLLLYLLPTLGILLFFGMIAAKPWHEGVLVVHWILVLGISFIKAGRSQLSIILTEAVVIVLIIQVSWSYTASINDVYGRYSAGKAVADYVIQNRLKDSVIYGQGYWITSVLPYFDDIIFDNFPAGGNPDYWIYTQKNKMQMEFGEKHILREKPDVLIISRPAGKEYEGYSRLKFFKANMYWKNRVFDYNHIAVYERAGSPSAPETRTLEKSPSRLTR